MSLVKRCIVVIAKCLFFLMYVDVIVIVSKKLICSFIDLSKTALAIYFVN